MRDELFNVLLEVYNCIEALKCENYGRTEDGLINVRNSLEKIFDSTNQ